MYIYIYMYDPSAWTPNSEFMQTYFSNHSAILTVQSLQCYVFFVCNILLTILKNNRFFWVFLNSYCKKYKTCVFCNILLKVRKNRWFPFVFLHSECKSITKPVLFALLCWTCWKTLVFLCFWRSYCKKPWMYNDFLHLFHTNTYTSTLHHGRKATLRVS